MVNPVKELGQVQVDYMAVALAYVLPGLLQGLVRILFCPETIAVFREFSIIHFSQLLRYGLLNQPVHIRWDTELTLAAIGFGNTHPLYCLWLVRSGLQFSFHRFPFSF